MQSLSPTSCYFLALREGSYRPSNIRQETMNRLDAIRQELQTQPAPVVSDDGLRVELGKLLGKREPVAETALVRGLYMWDGVGQREV